VCIIDGVFVVTYVENARAVLVNVEIVASEIIASARKFDV